MNLNNKSKLFKVIQKKVVVYNCYGEVEETFSEDLGEYIHVFVDIIKKMGKVNAEHIYENFGLPKNLAERILTRIASEMPSIDKTSQDGETNYCFLEVEKEVVDKNADIKTIIRRNRKMKYFSLSEKP